MTKADVRDGIVDAVNVGIFTVDADLRVRTWNRFMEIHSSITADAIVGKDLFDVFPELPRAWMSMKLKNVFQLGNYSFVSWRQRPYLFKFRHNRPITGGLSFMHQDCTFIPLHANDGSVDAVCVTIVDATDASLLQQETERNAALLQDALAELEKLSTTDPLTGVSNRRNLETRLTDEVNRFTRYGTPLSIVMFDLDYFKRVNDRYGHLGGDEVLRVVSRTVGAELRNTDTLGRYGGEEFMVVLPNTSGNDATRLAERLRARIATTPVPFGTMVIEPTASLGVAAAHPATTSPVELIHDADTALYAAKAGGRNCVRVHASLVADGSPPSQGPKSTTTPSRRWVTDGPVLRARLRPYACRD